MNLITSLAQEINTSESSVQAVVKLLDEGNTIPFIARYRKELHGGMEDTMLRQLEQRLHSLRNLERRKSEILSAIEKQEKLTPELQRQIASAMTITEVEDLYRPYQSKRRTRALMAREKGLEPLAEAIWRQSPSLPSLSVLAAEYIHPDHAVHSAEDALSGASDILAETISDDAAIRKQLRQYLSRNGLLSSKAAKEEDSVYELYYRFEAPIHRISSHQILAINRGEKNGFLKVQIRFDEEAVQSMIERLLIKGSNAEATAFLRHSIKDSLHRLLIPSLLRDIRNELTEQANRSATAMFAKNLKPLLMQPPVKGQITMGLDPGYRNGCKVAVVDGTGKLLDTAVIFPTLGQKERDASIKKLRQLIVTQHVRHIAIGNGTASRETEEVVAALLKEHEEPLSYLIVNESGASVYSASPLASEEFPNLDVNLRSAVSIARRLQDPLAELVKIDPKSIGVGLYQHDIPTKQLEEALSNVIEDCVNHVGVDVNTASPALLSYVAGLTQSSSKNIVAYREANGPFSSRHQLLKVPKIGAQTFKQCAGFLRVPESASILDHTAVHPESYPAAEKLLTSFHLDGNQMDQASIERRSAQLSQTDAEDLAVSIGIGLPTLLDIIKELKKPGRDPREELPPPIFRSGIFSMSDLTPGMTLMGTVRNVIDFGAFVDIGVNQDGLVHISKLSDRFVRHPSDVVSVGDIVQVTVLSVDETKKRISLSMQNPSPSV